MGRVVGEDTSDLVVHVLNQCWVTHDECGAQWIVVGEPFANEYGDCGAVGDLIVKVQIAASAGRESAELIQFLFI